MICAEICHSSLGCFISLLRARLGALGSIAGSTESAADGRDRAEGAVGEL